MIILLLISLLAVLWICYFRFKRQRLYELAAKIPSLPGEVPILGHAYRFIGDTEHIMNTLQSAGYYATKVGGTAKLWLSHILYIMIVDPADVETVLKTCLEKDDLHRFIKKIVGNGITVAPVPIWKARRKIMIPALSSKSVASFLDIFVDRSRVLADKLEGLCGTGSFDVWPYVNRYALESICESTLGIKKNTQDDPKVPFLTALNRIEALIIERMFHIWYQPDWLYRLFWWKYNEYQKCIGTMSDFVDEAIAKTRLKEMDENKNLTILDLLYNLSGRENGYTNLEIKEETLSIIIGGSDTSAVTLSNTLVLLGKYPEIQEKVHQELSIVFDDSTRPLVNEDYQKLQYLERVIRESMRLFPPAPILARKILKQTKLPSGYILPAGSGAAINIFAVHRNPKYWGPDAECFDPDRFLPQRLNLLYPCSYMPFSSGPRNCVGYQMAIMSIKAALSSILRRYKVVGKPEEGPIPQMRMKMNLTMKAVDGYHITLEKKRSEHIM